VMQFYANAGDEPPLYDY